MKAGKANCMVPVNRVVIYDDPMEIRVKFLDSEQYRRKRENVNAWVNSYPIRINPLTFKKLSHEKAEVANMRSQWNRQQKFT